MAMINCPECGTRISDSASACPYCGFKLTKNAIAKLELNSLSNVKKQALSICDFNNVEDIFISRDNANTIENIYKLFSDAKTLSQIAPSLFETIRSLCPETKLVANITPEIQKLLKSKEFAIVTDKNGDMMAIIKKVVGKKTFKKQIRLVEMNFNPNLMTAIINLQTQIALANIMESLRDMSVILSSIKTDIQDGRIALAESCLQQVKQAELINDSRLRELKLLEITSKSTEARCLLSKTIYRQFSFLRKTFKDDNDSIMKGKMLFVKDAIEAFRHNNIDERKDMASEDIFVSLNAIVKCVKVETEIYSILGEQQASAEVINQFRKLIIDNGLDNKEVLKLINSFSQKDYTPLINKFLNGSNHFLKLCSDNRIDNLLQKKSVLLLPGHASVPMVVSD